MLSRVLLSNIEINEINEIYEIKRANKLKFKNWFCLFMGNNGLNKENHKSEKQVVPFDNSRVNTTLLTCLFLLLMVVLLTFHHHR